MTQRTPTQAFSSRQMISTKLSAWFIINTISGKTLQEPQKISAVMIRTMIQTIVSMKTFKVKVNLVSNI